MSKKLNSRSFIAYRDNENEKGWFLITSDENNKRIEIPAKSEEVAIKKWKENIESNLITKPNHNYKFNALVKNVEEKWNYQLTYDYNYTEKKVTLSKESISPKKSKPEIIEEKAIDSEKISKEENKKAVNKKGSKYFEIANGWVIFYLIILFLLFLLAIIALPLLYN